MYLCISCRQSDALLARGRYTITSESFYRTRALSKLAMSIFIPFVSGYIIIDLTPASIRDYYQRASCVMFHSFVYINVGISLIVQIAVFKSLRPHSCPQFGSSSTSPKISTPSSWNVTFLSFVFLFFLPFAFSFSPASPSSVTPASLF